jgi:hypothetical protein
MADTVRGVEYYYVTVPDAPGEGQRILSALEDGGVNLLAYLGFPLGGGQSQIDLVPEDPQSLKEAAERAGLTLSEPKRAFLIQGDDRVGAVTATTARLAEANINITAAAATGAGAGRYGMILWVAATDYERAADALGARARRMAPRSQMERLLYLDQNYLSGIVKRKVAFRELEPTLRMAVARGAVGVPESEAHRLESAKRVGAENSGWSAIQPQVGESGRRPAHLAQHSVAKSTRSGIRARVNRRNTNAKT